MAAVSERPTNTPDIPNYRQQVRRALPDHYFKPDTQMLWWFPVHFAIIGAGLWALVNHFSWWYAPFLSIVMGNSMVSMGFLAHDIAHGASVRNPHTRDWLAAIGFSPLWIGPLLWRKWHNADHHNNTNIPGIDPDHLFTMEAYKESGLLQWLYRLSPLARNLTIFGSFGIRMSHQMTTMLLIHLKDPDTTPRERKIMIAQYWLPMLFWVGLTAAFGWKVLLMGYLIPLAVTNYIAIGYIATNHFLNPLADERDVLGTSLSVTLPKGFGWLDACHNYFGAHVAHHLFPQAPARYGRAIEAKVAEIFPDRYHVLPINKALKTLWDTPWIFEDNETLIDPPRQIRSKTLGRGLKP